MLVGQGRRSAGRRDVTLSRLLASSAALVVLMAGALTPSRIWRAAVRLVFWFAALTRAGRGGVATARRRRSALSMLRSARAAASLRLRAVAALVHSCK